MHVARSRCKQVMWSRQQRGNQSVLVNLPAPSTPAVSKPSPFPAPHFTKPRPADGELLAICEKPGALALAWIRRPGICALTRPESLVWMHTVQENA